MLGPFFGYEWFDFEKLRRRRGEREAAGEERRKRNIAAVPVGPTVPFSITVAHFFSDLSRNRRTRLVKFGRSVSAIRHCQIDCVF